MEAQENIPGYICGYVGGNEVGEKGCRHLSKAAWGELEAISLCNCSLTQGITKSGTGAAGTSAGEPGCELKELNCVLIKIIQMIVA